MRLRVALLPILTAAIASGIAAADIQAQPANTSRIAPIRAFHSSLDPLFEVQPDARYQQYLVEGLRWAIGN